MFLTFCKISIRSSKISSTRNKSQRWLRISRGYSFINFRWKENIWLLYLLTHTRKFKRRWSGWKLIQMKKCFVRWCITQENSSKVIWVMKLIKIWKLKVPIKSNGIYWWPTYAKQFHNKKLKTSSTKLKWWRSTSWRNITKTGESCPKF